MNRRAIYLLLLFIAASHTASAQSSIIPFQGYVTDEAGAPLPDGNYSLTFRLYSAATGGDALWSEAKLVTVANGLFATGLGTVSTLNTLSFDAPYWLGVQVGTQEELQPRIALGAVPYSLRAATVADGAITSAKIADQAVTAAKLAPGAVTTSAIAPSSVTSDQLGNGAVNTSKLADHAVTGAKLATGSVTADRLASGSVTTAKLANQAVSGAKISTAGAAAGQTLVYNGTSVVWRTPSAGFSLPYSGSVNEAGSHAFAVTNTTKSGPAWGVAGILQSATGSGLFGWAQAGTGAANGVVGRSLSTSGTGVYGISDATTGTTYGVRGLANSTSGYAGYFEGRGHFSGYLGVGTTNPTARLHLESPVSDGDVAINMKVGGSWTAQIQQTSSSVFSFSNGGQIRMNIQPNGRVGIGTTSPAAALDVNGDARVTGELRNSRNGNANMMPIAYGMVSGNGTLNANSGNVTVSRVGAGRYSISIQDESVLYTNYIILATPASAVSIRASSAGGSVRILTDGTFGAADGDFYFVVYKP